MGQEYTQPRNDTVIWFVLGKSVISHACHQKMLHGNIDAWLHAFKIPRVLYKTSLWYM